MINVYKQSLVRTWCPDGRLTPRYHYKF